MRRSLRLERLEDRNAPAAPPTPEAPIDNTRCDCESSPTIVIVCPILPEGVFICPAQLPAPTPTPTPNP